MKTIVIYGPTAVGKSDIAILLAKKINAEIISADSMQIYKDLNVGSAKITEQETQGIKHHLLDIRDSLESYSAFEFCEDCKKIIADINARGKNVVICGGTGLYIKALTEHYDCGTVICDEEFRKRCEALTNEELYKMLEQLAPEKAKTIHINNKHRMIRALEIATQKGCAKKSDYDDNFVIFGLIDDREVLYQRINKRVDKMQELGLVEEVKYLLNHGATLECQSMKAIGYKELVPYINGEKSLVECLDQIKQRTRNYAKRQLTFMNQFPNIIKVNVTTKEDTAYEIYKILEVNNWITTNNL